MDHGFDRREAPRRRLAGDTLERILAVDRADTPAVTTRRQLAEHDPPRPRLVPRCEIPYWFDDLVAQARADLNDAQRRAVDLHDRHREVASRLAATTTQLDRVTRETASERAELRAAAEAVSNVEVRHRIVERRLGEVPWRHRRALRRELNICDAELDTARSRLKDVTVRTSDDMQQYGSAWALHNEAVDDEHSLHLAAILDGWQLDPPTAAARVDALDTWRTWAAGRQVTAEHLDDAAAALAEWNHADVRRLVVSLAETGIEIPTARAMEPIGIDLDL